jgi:hypothetical protein
MMMNLMNLGTVWYLGWHTYSGKDSEDSKEEEEEDDDGDIALMTSITVPLLQTLVWIHSMKLIPIVLW